ncbi:hypothetical protein R1sor_009784 [Riccia sorocarpa]|uniref:Uncharacterized protein n=1 Tax=Riccia sorocarpa TaxID=122646 RepID=A0ABD3HWC8_9MARC
MLSFLSSSGLTLKYVERLPTLLTTLFSIVKTIGWWSERRTEASCFMMTKFERKKTDQAGLDRVCQQPPLAWSCPAKRQRRNTQEPKKVVTPSNPATTTPEVQQATTEGFKPASKLKGKVNTPTPVPQKNSFEALAAIESKDEGDMEDDPMSPSAVAASQTPPLQAAPADPTPTSQMDTEKESKRKRDTLQSHRSMVEMVASVTAGNPPNNSSKDGATALVPKETTPRAKGNATKNKQRLAKA